MASFKRISTGEILKPSTAKIRRRSEVGAGNFTQAWVNLGVDNASHRIVMEKALANIKKQQEEQRQQRHQQTVQAMQDPVEAMQIRGSLPSGVGQVSQNRIRALTTPDALRQDNIWTRNSTPSGLGTTPISDEALETIEANLSDKSARQLERINATATHTSENQDAWNAYGRTTRALDRVRGQLETAQDRKYYEGLSNRRAELESVQTAQDFSSTIQKATEAGSKGIPNKPKYNAVRDVAQYASLKNMASTGAALPEFALPQKFADSVSGTVKVGYMTDSELNTALYYIGCGDYDGASEYLSTLERDLNQRANSQVQEKVGEWAKEHPIQAAATNMTSWPLDIPAYLDNAGQAIKSAVTGERTPADPNRDAYLGARISNATSRGAAEAARESAEKTFGSSTAGDVAAFLTQTGLSIGRNVSQIASMGPYSLAGMALSAAGTATVDAIDRGATPTQAFLVGTANGAIEAVTEKIGLDNLFGIIGQSGRQTAKQVVVNTFRQMGAEASEEILAEIGDNIVDTAVMGQESEYKQYVTSLMNQGMSRQEAESKAFTQFYIYNVLLAGAGGALSGGVMGGGASLFNQAVALADTIQYKRASNQADTAIDQTYQSMLSDGLFSTEAAQARGQANTQLENIRGAYDLGQQAAAQPERGIIPSPSAADTTQARRADTAIDQAYQAMIENGLFSTEAAQARENANAQLENVRGEYDMGQRNQRNQSAAQTTAQPGRETASGEEVPGLSLPSLEAEESEESAAAGTVQNHDVATKNTRIIQSERIPQQSDPSIVNEPGAPLDNADQIAYNGSRAERAGTDAKGRETTDQESGNVYGTTYVDGNTPLEFEYKIVPAESLTTSNDIYGNVNEAYPSELQPRDRTRAASQMQIQEMSRNLNPALLADSPTAQNGAPIVREDGVVVGGNARTQAILEAYRTGSAGEYKSYIQNNGARYGVDTSTLPENPVLVRVARNVKDWASLGQKLNASTISSYSTTEQGMQDAKKIGDILALLTPNEEGKINTRENQNFINRFISDVVPSSERSGLTTANGMLSQQGLERVQNAIFAAAYNDASLLARLSESLDNDAKNITNALLSTASRAAVIRHGEENGTLYDLGVVDGIRDAVDIFLAAKQRGETVEEYTSQQRLDGEFDPFSVYLAQFMEKNKRSAKQIRGLILNLYDEIESYGDPNQGTIFDGGANHDRTELLQGAAKRYQQATGRELDAYTGRSPGNAGVAERSGGGSVQWSGPQNEAAGQSGQEYLASNGEGVGAESEPEELTLPRAEEYEPEYEPEDRAQPRREESEPEPEARTQPREEGYEPEDLILPGFEESEVRGADRARKFHPRGENAFRQVDVPRKDSEGRNIPKAAATVLEAKATPDSAVGVIQDAIESGELSFDTITDRAAESRARALIEKNGWEAALNKFHEEAEKGIISKDNIALGQLLLINAMNAKDNQATVDILSDYAHMSTVSAQSLQAQRILKKLSPEWQLYQVQKMVDGLNERRAGRNAREDAAGSAEEQDILRTMEEEREKALDQIRNMDEFMVDDTDEDAERFYMEADTDAALEVIRNMDEFDSEQDHGIPVGEWPGEIGRLLSGQIKNRLSQNDGGENQVPISITIQQDLMKFAENYLGKRKGAQKAKRTAADRIRDYFNNQEIYAKAWNAAVANFKQENQDNQRLMDAAEDFLGGTINYNATGSDRVMMQAVFDSALSADTKIRNIVTRYGLGDQAALVDEISTRLITEVDAAVTEQIIIRDAVARWLENTSYKYGQDHNFDIDSDMGRRIRKAMKDIGIKMADIIEGSRESQEQAAAQIAAMLVEDYGVSDKVAEDVGDQVAEHFNEMVRSAAQKKLDAIFSVRERSRGKTRSQYEQFQRLVNLGGFDGSWNSEAAQSIFGIGKNQDAERSDSKFRHFFTSHREIGEIRISQELIEKFRAAENQNERDGIMEEIYRDVARQVPATWKEKWNAWRYLAMLANPRTHIRNILGNAGFYPARSIKNLIATGMEAAADAVLPGGIGERTKSRLSLLSDSDRALVRAGLQDVANVEDELLSSGKYRDDVTGKIEDYRTIFKIKALEAARKANSTALDVEDTWFSKPAYAGAFARYLKANGITAQAFLDGSADSETVDKARAWAIEEAKKATYRDDNLISEAISKLSRPSQSKNKLIRGAGYVVEGVLPFKKTPANILSRGLEYSPAGLLKGLTYDLYQAHAGKITAAKAIDNIAAGLTGTGLVLLGAVLARAGIVSGGGAEDEKERDQYKLTGGQDYALNIGNQSITLDWLAPEALPFFVGVELWNNMADRSRESASLADILSAVSRITDPMLEMSMLQGLQDAIENAAYSDSPLISIPANAAISYLSQGIPTLFGQFERSLESYRKSTYVDRNSGVPKAAQRILGQTFNKLPGEYHQIPYIDAWGRAKGTGNAAKRIFDNILNPACTSTIDVTDVDAEVQRLYKAGYSVLPSSPSQSVQVAYKENEDDEDTVKRYLTADEYVKYATTSGTTAFSLIDEILGDSLYKNLSDEEKASVVESIYHYSREVSAGEVEERHEPKSYVIHAKNAQEELGLSEADYLILNSLYGSATMGGDGIRKAYEKGVDPLEYLAYTAAAREADEDDSGSLSIAERAAAMEASGLDEKSRLKIWKSLYPKWEEKAEEAGLSFSDVVKYKVAISSAGAKKKEEKIKALRAAGYSAAKAEKLYQILK